MASSTSDRANGRSSWRTSSAPERTVFRGHCLWPSVDLAIVAQGAAPLVVALWIWLTGSVFLGIVVAAAGVAVAMAAWRWKLTVRRSGVRLQFTCLGIPYRTVDHPLGVALDCVDDWDTGAWFLRVGVGDGANEFYVGFDPGALVDAIHRAIDRHTPPQSAVPYRRG